MAVSEAKPSTVRAWGLLLVIVATAAWSTAGVWVKIVMAESGISVIYLAFWRDFITFLLLLSGMMLLNRAGLRVRARDLRWLALMGAIGIGLFHVLWNLSVQYNGASIATVLQYNAPIIVAVSARMLWGESLTWRKLTAIALAFSGTLLIALPGATGIHITLTGLIIGLASAAAISVYSLVGRRLTGAYPLWTIMTYIFGFGALAVLPLAVLTGDAWTLTPAAVGAFLSFVGIPTLGGFGFYTAGLKRLPASVAAIVATTEVPLAGIVAFFALGERLSGVQWAGVFLVMFGVVLVSAPARWFIFLQRPGAASRSLLR